MHAYYNSKYVSLYIYKFVDFRCMVETSVTKQFTSLKDRNL